MRIRARSRPPKRAAARGPDMLELRSVDAGYGSFQALFGVSLEVKAGEAVGVIGPTKGAITMEGTDVLATPAHRIVSLGIAHVPENRRLFPRLTVDDNLKMGAFMPGARAKYAERLEFVFDLLKRIRASGLTVLIVEQNVQQVLRVVDRAYLLEAGSLRASGTSAEMMSSDTIKQAYLGV